MSDWDQASLRAMLTEVAAEYPPALRAGQLADVERTAFNIGLVLERMGTQVKLADIGAGIGLFTVGCARVGMQTWLVDDFRDQINFELGDSILDLHRRAGVHVLSEDVTADPLELGDGVLDVWTSFHSIEHWHHSPKRALHEALRVLRPGGLFLLCGPNAVNLRKRIGVPLGRSNWSHFEDYYENPVFRGHVREPCADDFRRIAVDLGLERPVILGRNWMGRDSASTALRLAARMADGILSRFPGLCSDLYLLGYRAGA